MKILDACCGSRMFWWDKHNPEVTYMDKRRYYEKLKSGHTVDVDPDVQADFTNMPFKNSVFDLVVFDPPHLIHAGKTSWLSKKYGTLDKSSWPTVIHDGFQECNRVVKPNGVIIFKWNEEQISFSKVIKVIGRNPLFGDRRGKTRWVVFEKAIKSDENGD